MKTITLLILLAMPVNALAFQCGECHSKNPKLRAMHKALNYEGCGNCHRTDVRSIAAMKFPEEEKKNRPQAPRCKSCHRK